MSQRDAHETYAVAAARLHWIAAALAVSLLAIAALMYALSRVLMSGAAQPPGQPLPPQPRLQAHPAADLATQRAREQALLDGYAWSDRDAGAAAGSVAPAPFARIPIDRAMRLLIERQPAASRTESPR